MTENQPLTKREEIEELLGFGVPAHKVADILGVPMQSVESVYFFRAAHGLTAEDKELADEVRTLTKIALEKTKNILMMGPPGEQLQLIKTLLSSASKLIGAEKGLTMEGLRAEFDGLMGSMKQAGMTQARSSGRNIIDVPHDD